MSFLKVVCLINELLVVSGNTNLLPYLKSIKASFIFRPKRRNEHLLTVREKVTLYLFELQNRNSFIFNTV